MLEDVFDDPMAEFEPEPEETTPVRPEAQPTVEDEALRQERYAKLIALGVPPYRAEAGSLDGQAFLAARIFHRGI